MFRLALLSCLLCLARAVGWDTVTPLDAYIARPDPHYKWQFIAQPSSGDDSVNSYVVNMTSQKWKDESVLDRPIWWHYLIINIPKNLQVKDAATLFVGGGHNSGSRIPTPGNDQFAALAVSLAKKSGAVTGYLKQIPNQPIVFKDDPLQKSRSEDSLIAYTWRRFIEDTSDPEILLRMPMTKAGVRAMDTMTDFCKQKDVTNDISEFLIGGASKRGWTAWTLAAVDKRVIGLVPMVMDLVNMQPPYRTENIPTYLDNPNMTKMADIIDPYCKSVGASNMSPDN
ncbi:hypothetical protein NP493_670g01041 [Ridgeia piscesae]|uniref:PhoPQ-activated pathogenicity-related protein n=1 Tax=Ridgeia piscesae TaxID=27915 RepID=A0AAD9KS10_RIDPI|nr:hypothetical protein NP493_670g01041 [Ridgeia piscesae]